MRKWIWIVVFFALASAALAASAPSNAAPVRVWLGNEILALQRFEVLRGKKIGLITNPSGVNSRKRSTIDVLRAAPGVHLAALFGAEHGLSGEAPAGQEVKDAVDPHTKLPVYSLYGPGPTRKPTARMLKGLDALVYDIQDTGCRAYTFISTLGLAMEACAEAGIEFIVLDRPNPAGGVRVEGPRLKPAYRSFVGQWDIPYVYGLTCGELALMINGEGWIKKPCDLSVVPMKGWRREMVWRDTGLPWTPTSPFIRRGDAPLYQIAMGILGEIGGVSIGMGTDLPFQCVAAPWFDAQKLCDWLNQRRLPGVVFEPLHFKPERGAYRNQTVHGARIVFSNPQTAPLTALNYYALEAAKTLAGRDLLRAAVKSGKNFGMFDKVNGTDAVRHAWYADPNTARLLASWRPGEEKFRQQRKRYLLY
jgi:uncharacterized protein YbbC (DUF1343 family)